MVMLQEYLLHYNIYYSLPNIALVKIFFYSNGVDFNERKKFEAATKPTVTVCLFGQESYRNNSFFKKYYSLKKLLELIFLSVCSPKIGLENLLENGDGSKVRFIKHHIHISSFSRLTTTTKNNRKFKLKKLLLKIKKTFL